MAPFPRGPFVHGRVRSTRGRLATAVALAAAAGTATAGCVRVHAGGDLAGEHTARAPMLAPAASDAPPGAVSLEGLLRARVVARARVRAGSAAALDYETDDGAGTLDDPGAALAFVRRVLADAGADVAAVGVGPHALADLHAGLARRRALYRDHLPVPGDLVFLRATYAEDPAAGAAATTAASAPARATGAVTHVALAVDVAGDGTIDALGFRRGAARRDRLNPYHPTQRLLDGRIVNSFVRIIRPDDPPGTRYLAGELLESFGDSAAFVPPVSSATPSSAGGATAK
ncbi:MAG TPA: hypothetical protein VG389_09070 [Myxococcota bacterium]|jgi:hypothetical protein|nr:hypothetical protein [Myxococcota bacterium]